MLKLNDGAAVGSGHRRRSAARKISIMGIPATTSGVGYSAATILLTTIQPIRAGVTAREAVAAVEEIAGAATAVEISGSPKRILIYRNPLSLDSFQTELCISLESLQNAAFSFASRA